MQMKGTSLPQTGKINLTIGKKKIGTISSYNQKLLNKKQGPKLQKKKTTEVGKKIRPNKGIGGQQKPGKKDQVLKHVRKHK